MNFYTNVAVHGGKILYRGVQDGVRIDKKLAYSPTMYVSANEGEWKTFYTGKPLKAVTFNGIKEARDFIKTYDGVSGMEVHGMEKFEYQFITEMFPSEISYDIRKLLIYTIDIETTVDLGGFPDIQEALESVLLISVRDKFSQKTITWSSKGEYDVDKSENCTYKPFNTEKAMLRDFCLWFNSNCPDIITGWNIEGFDIPFLCNRIARVLGEEYVTKLSPWGVVKERTYEIKGKEIQSYDIIGVSVIDYLDAYKKFSFSPQENYSLDNIAKVELDDEKLPFDGSFKEFYQEKNWKQFVAYNQHDVTLVDKLDNKMNFIELIATMAYITHCNYKDVFGMVRMWDCFIFNYCYNNKIAIPPMTRKTGGSFEGAYVKEPVPQMFGWSMTFDFGALYPTTMRQWNISPETLLPIRMHVTVDDIVERKDYVQDLHNKAVEENASFCANGTFYSKEKKGIIPILMELLTKNRKVVKNKKLQLEQEYEKTKETALEFVIASMEVKQLGIKLTGNSGYGALSNVGSRYYSLAIAEGITTTAQLCNKDVEREVNEFMNKLFSTENHDYSIYGDTDSQFLNVQPFVDTFCVGKNEKEVVKYLDKVGQQIQKRAIQKSLDEVFVLCNCIEKLQDMKREKISSKGFIIGKKRYALRMLNSEGVDYEPYKLKVTGLEIVRSSTPISIRNTLKDSVLTILNGEEKELIDYVAEFSNKFNKMPPDEIAFPRGVSDIDKWVEGNGYKSGCPIHVRAAIVYNKLIKDKPEYAPLANGDRLRFVYLRMPNPVKENVFGWPASIKLPEEFGLHKYIDYDLQFEKVFETPIKNIATAIKWKIKEESTIMSLFG